MPLDTFKSARPTNVTKPCRTLLYCPYGPLVEEFPLASPSIERSCAVFGHNCPVFTCAEMVVDDEKHGPIVTEE